MKLHGYFRSSASYRVRIALNLKGLSTEHLPHHLRKGEQCAPAYLAINPQGLVPTLENDAGAVLTQSLAIIEWLDETHPKPPLLPRDPLRRAKVRAFAMALACDTHPVQNLKVLARLRQLKLPEEQVTEWAAWANREGLAACENLIADDAGAICGAGFDPHPSRHRCDAAVGGDRVRPLDARQRDRAAGNEKADRPKAVGRRQAGQAALPHQGGRGGAARDHALGRACAG